MAKPQTIEEFDADLQARQKAVAAAGWQGSSARMLILRGNTQAEFEGHLAEAKTMLAIANMVRNQLTDAGVNVDLAVERSIIHGFPLAEIRLAIVDVLAERDMVTHTDTSPPFAQSAGDVYADRKAQMKAGNAR